MSCSIKSDVNTTYDWYLHHHAAQQLSARLLAIRNAPKSVLIAGADGAASVPLLLEHYRKAKFSQYETRESHIKAQQVQVAQRLKPRLFQKIRYDFNQAPLSDAPKADWLWSVFGLCEAPSWQEGLKAWARQLNDNGLVFFSHFGDASLKELLHVVQVAGFNVALPVLSEMHDLGDALLQAGFDDPVTDTETLQLDYQTFEGLLADLCFFGLMRHLACDNKATLETFLRENWQAKRLHRVTLEIVYGHAIKRRSAPKSCANLGDNTFSIEFI